jgi:uncharacterized protein (DUF58 family)
MKPLWRVVYRLYRLFSWMRYWAARRFTNAGLAVLVSICFAAILGVDTENTVGYQAFTLLFFLLLMAVVCSLRFKAHFSAVRLLPRFGTVGRVIRYRVLVRNLSSKNQTSLTLLENLADPRPSFSDWHALQRHNERRLCSFKVSRRKQENPFNRAAVKESPVPEIPPGEEAETIVELTPLRRGVLRFAGVTLARPDPLGLFRAFRKEPLPQSILILPKRYTLPPVALPGTMKYQEGGVAMASNVGHSEEFVSLREYRRGDPLRHIHWRSWAKTGRPIVKEFEDEFFVRHALVLDTFADSPHSEVFEEAVSVAASFACTVITQESLLDLLFVGSDAYCFTAGRGLAHADQMLEILASVRICTERPFASLEHLVLDHAASVSGCICVLLAWDEQRREFVKRLKSLRVPLKVLIVAPDNDSSEFDPGPMRDELDRFHVLEAGKIEEELAKL